MRVSSSLLLILAAITMANAAVVDSAVAQKHHLARVKDGKVRVNALDTAKVGVNHVDLKNLKYLDMCIQETLRIHSTSSQGLPRLVPPGPGVEIAGHHFAQGTVLSVPAYTMHHSKEIWGKDADEFRPERWETVTER